MPIIIRKNLQKDKESLEAEVAASNAKVETTKEEAKIATEALEARLKESEDKLIEVLLLPLLLPLKYFIIRLSPSALATRRPLAYNCPSSRIRDCMYFDTPLPTPLFTRPIYPTILLVVAMVGRR